MLAITCSSFYGQYGLSRLSKSESNRTIKSLDSLNNSKTDQYSLIFDKEDEIKYKTQTFLVKYYSSDSLVIAFDDYTKFSSQEKMAQLFFEAPQFQEFNYFIILFGISRIEKAKDGGLILKKYIPTNGIIKTTNNE